jgi:3-hydroxybutyrate dehydrogenase
MSLRGHVALVTGAASGIGKCISDVFLREGARVAVTDLSLSGAQETAKELSAKWGRGKDDFVGLELNVADEGSVDRAVKKVSETLGAPTLLVANAGVQIISPIVDFTLEQWRKVTSVRNGTNNNHANKTQINQSAHSSFSMIWWGCCTK